MTLRFSTRLFLTYLLLICIAFYFMLTLIVDEVKPSVRQATEDTMVDMAHVMASMVDMETLNSASGLETLNDNIQSFLSRTYKASIFGVPKTRSQLRVYITDSYGRVIFDSTGKDVGRDYSRWNDVYLTLRGEYGVRSTQTDPNDELSTVMHVAAPIIENGQIVGVLTVAKPNITVQPFIDDTQKALYQQSAMLLILAIAITLMISVWHSRSIGKLVSYANRVSAGASPSVPQLSELELNRLANAIETMRNQLEGKQYVENFVLGLTHELKSPISAIKGAAEILRQKPDEQDSAHFLTNIEQQSIRLEQIVSRLLTLTKIESMNALQQVDRVDICDLIQQVLCSKQDALNKSKVTVQWNHTQHVMVPGDPLLLAQAIDNVLQNAINFSDANSVIDVTIIAEDKCEITVLDKGPGIPDFAIDKVFERFYSLPPPGITEKSSGLGLCFVRQIIELHQGQFTLRNTHQGVEAKILLPM